MPLRPPTPPPALPPPPPPTSRPGGPPPPAAPAFAPARLRAADLAVRVTPGMRDMPSGMREEVVRQHTALVRRFALGAPWRLRRLRLHLAGSLVGLPLAALFFTPLGLAHLPALLPGSLLFALVSGWLRPPPALLGLCFVAAVLLGLVLAGQGGFLFSFPPRPAAFFALLGLHVCGHAVGLSNDLSRGDE